MTDEEIEKLRCEFDLDDEPCEKCKKNEGPCYFLSDGGFEPRDGRYLCKECLVALFTVCNNFALGISCDCDECKTNQLALEQEFEGEPTNMCCVCGGPFNGINARFVERLKRYVHDKCLGGIDAIIQSEA